MRRASGVTRCVVPQTGQLSGRRWSRKLPVSKFQISAVRSSLLDLQFQPVAHHRRLVVRPVALQMAKEGGIESGRAQMITGNVALVQFRRLVRLSRLTSFQHSRLLPQYFHRDALTGHSVHAAQQSMRADGPYAKPKIKFKIKICINSLREIRTSSRKGHPSSQKCTASARTGDHERSDGSREVRS